MEFARARIQCPAQLLRLLRAPPLYQLMHANILIYNRQMVPLLVRELIS